MIVVALGKYTTYKSLLTGVPAGAPPGEGTPENGFVSSQVNQAAIVTSVTLAGAFDNPQAPFVTVAPPKLGAPTPYCPAGFR